MASRPPIDPHSPLGWVISITKTKVNQMQGTENDELAEKAYVPFLVNRGLSLYADTVLYANEMNMRPLTDKRLQYEYLLNTIRKSPRYAKWPKSESSEELDAVKRFYGYNDEKAKQALRVLTADQLKTIKQRLDTGGK